MDLFAIVNHIIQSRIDNAENPDVRSAWKSAKHIIEYALIGDIEALCNYDYLLTNEEKEIGASITMCADGFIAEIHSDEAFEKMCELLYD